MKARSAVEWQETATWPGSSIIIERASFWRAARYADQLPVQSNFSFSVVEMISCTQFDEPFATEGEALEIVNGNFDGEELASRDILMTSLTQRSPNTRQVGRRTCLKYFLARHGERTASAHESFKKARLETAEGPEQKHRTSAQPTSNHALKSCRGLDHSAPQRSVSITWCASSKPVFQIHGSPQRVPSAWAKLCADQTPQTECPDLRHKSTQRVRITAISTP